MIKTPYSTLASKRSWGFWSRSTMMRWKISTTPRIRITVTTTVVVVRLGVPTVILLRWVTVFYPSSACTFCLPSRRTSLPSTNFNSSRRVALVKASTTTITTIILMENRERHLAISSSSSIRYWIRFGTRSTRCRTCIRLKITVLTRSTSAREWPWGPITVSIPLDCPSLMLLAKGQANRITLKITSSSKIMASWRKPKPAVSFLSMHLCL